MALIRFTEGPNGQVDYTLVIEKGETSMSPAFMAAFALAKRGLTRREMDKYKLAGSFGWEVEE